MTLAAAVPVYGQQQLQQLPPGYSSGAEPRMAANRDQPGGAVPPQLATVMTPLAPAWIPLPPQHEQYVNEVLNYWEFKSSQTKRYRCKFKRWEYDPVFGPSDTFKTYSEGVVKYSAPDKGLFQVEKLLQYQLESGNANYVPAAEESYEHWVCDGHWIYEFDYRNKKLILQELPPEMRGQAIGKGPLPFLFNAKAAELRERFWIRVVTPADASQEYWLEAVPRTQEDAANFKMAHVVIDAKDYMPKAIVLFDRNFVPGKPTSRTSFEFYERDVNYSVIPEKLNVRREFFEPELRKGWTKEVRPCPPASGMPSTANRNGAPPVR
jgi:TIGR03009 family protein